jgi:hypothetical protein
VDQVVTVVQCKVSVFAALETSHFCLTSPSLFTLAPATLGTIAKRPSFPVPTSSHPLPCSAPYDTTSATLLKTQRLAASPRVRSTFHACLVLRAS